MELLKTLDKKTKILNISNCGLKGVLDLKDFKYLEELDCSNNEITEITDIPETLKYRPKIKSMVDGAHISVIKNKFKEMVQYVDNSFGEFRTTLGVKFMNVKK